MAQQFDLIIIGSGSGNSIPDYLADANIALIERDPQFGGTCLNRGCIPSKMFVLPADLMVDAGHADRLGLDIDVNGANWGAIRDRVFGRIDPISASGRAYRESGTPNVTLFSGTAKFVDHKVVEVDGERLAGDHILIAAGSRPHVPNIAGLTEAGFCTSDDVMRLDAFPNRLGILGSGFIAVEMGHVFSAYGSEVTLLSRSERAMRKMDADIAARFTEAFSQRINFTANATPTRVERDDTGATPVWRVEYTQHDTTHVVEVDRLLVATGRTPNVDLLDLDATGVGLSATGVIDVDEHMRTTVDGIWAIGDIANNWELKHVANAEARVAFWNIAHCDDPNTPLRTMDYSAVPAAVFSHPQLATVGMTEDAARATGRRIAVGTRDYGGTAYGWAIADETSFAKVVIDADSTEILGAHIMGPQASTLIQPLIQAIQFGDDAEKVARGQLWIHPALTEVVENALLAALTPDA